MDSLRTKRRRVAGIRGPASAFTPGSSQRATAQTLSQPGPSRHSRADSIESDAEDDYEHTGVSIPDQLPSLPEDHEEDDSMGARDTDDAPPKPLSRSERLREILKFRGLAERYGEEVTREGRHHASHSDLRLAQAIHAYAINYYVSRGMMPEDKAKGGNDDSLRTRSGNTRGGQSSIDRGRDIIPPHLIDNSAKKPSTAVLGHVDGAAPYEMLSDPADSDFVASDNEEGDDEEAEGQVESPKPRRTSERGRKTEAGTDRPPESVEGAFDETALFAICEYRLAASITRIKRLTGHVIPPLSFAAAYVEETVRSLLGDHGTSVV